LRSKNGLVKLLPVKPLTRTGEETSCGDGVCYSLESMPDIGQSVKVPEQNPNYRTNEDDRRRGEKPFPPAEYHKDRRPEKIELFFYTQRPGVTDVPRASGIIIGCVC